MKQGPLIILSGPSGSGKSTVVARVVAESGLPLYRAVTATTRPPRAGEEHGVHYYFFEPTEFEAMIGDDALLEWAQVHGEHYYGTPRSEVEPFREAGTGVILVIDVQGAAQVRTVCPNGVSVFLRTSTPDVLERRLRERGTEDETTIQRRLATAAAELPHAKEYTHEVLNDDLAAAVRDLTVIIRKLFEG